MVDGVNIGSFGKLHPKVAKNFDLPETILYFEYNLDRIIAQPLREIPYSEPNKFPSMTRELNFVMDTQKSTGEIAKIIASLDDRIHSLSIRDVYEHEKIGQGKKSVTF